MLRSAVLRDLKQNIDLSPDEQVILVVQRHPVMLLLRLLPALAVFALASSLLWFRSAGGVFLVADAAAPLSFTLADQILALILAISALGWWFTRRRQAFSRALRRALLISALLLALLLAFRARGGRLFYIDPIYASGFDGFNGVLSMLVVASLAYAFYTFVDWSNDQLVMTSERIILDNDVLLIRREQEQLPVSEIQNVLARTETYLEHWLNFGTIIIQSATAGNRLIFRAASDPLPAQTQIMAELKRLHKRRNEDELKRMLERTVFNHAVLRAPGSILPRRVVQERQLGRVFRENPTFNPDSETYTWNPHWVLLVQSTLRPVLLLLLALGLLSAAGATGVVSGGLLIGAILVVAVVFGGWLAYEVEDYRNERYVLTPTTVLDVMKRPLGPESRRSAKLDALQNVFYRTTLLSQILGYGDVTLETAGAGGAFTFVAIPNPREVVALIHEYQANYRKREQEKNLESSLILLRQYHAATQAAAGTQAA